MEFLSKVTSSVSEDRWLLATLVTLASGYIIVKRSFADDNSDVYRLKKPRGAKWFWGHERESWETSNFRWFIDNAKTSGPTFAMKGAMFHPDLMVTIDPVALNYIFTKHAYSYHKAYITYSLAERMLGRGLLWATGSTHKKQRALVSPFFTHPQIRRTSDGIESLVLRFVNKLHASLPDSTTSTRVDMVPWLSKAALDVIGMIAFGIDFECGESAEAKVIIDTFESQTTIGMTLVGFVAPVVLRAFPWATEKLFTFTKAQGSVKTLIKSKVAAILVERRKEGLLGGAGEDEDDAHVDLLDALMKTTDMDDEKEVDEMLDQINTMILAGYETIAKSLCMGLYELALHPQLQNDLRKEITNARGSKCNGRPTYDEYLGSKLPLLDATVNEILRYHPIISHTERVPSKDDVIPLRYAILDRQNKAMRFVRVKKGQVIYIPTVAINRSPLLWGHDADQFDPYRWIEPGRVPAPSELTNGIDGHFGFFEGARMCIGYRLAIYEMKVIIAELLRRFEFTPSDGEKVSAVWAATMQPFVEGRKHEGASLPLLVRPLD